VEQTEKALWCLATEIADTTFKGATGKDSGARTVQVVTPAALTEVPVPARYTTAAVLNEDLDALRRIGFKGFFASGFQTNPEETGIIDWMGNPASLDWLHDYGARIEREASAFRYVPRILFYPQNAPGPAHIGPVPGSPSTFWLNSFELGEALDLWPSYSGYSLRRGNETLIVLMSLGGRRETHLWNPNLWGSNTTPTRIHTPVGDSASIRAYTPEGADVPLKKIGKTGLSVMLDTTPTIFVIPSKSLESAPHLVVQEAA